MSMASNEQARPSNRTFLSFRNLWSIERIKNDVRSKPHHSIYYIQISCIYVRIYNKNSMLSNTKSTSKTISNTGHHACLQQITPLPYFLTPQHTSPYSRAYHPSPSRYYSHSSLSSPSHSRTSSLSP